MPPNISNRLLHVRPKETWGPKTESSARTVPLCDPAVEALQMACERAGVPHIRVHGLRHTFGSQMAMAGADPFAIMKAMGHTDIKRTMICVSLGKSHIRDQVEKLNAICLIPQPTKEIRALPALACAN